MAEHETTMHATGGRDGSVTLFYARGTVLVETRRTDGGPQTVALDLDQFLYGMDTILGAIANDENLSAHQRVIAWRAGLGDAAELVRQAAVEEAADLTRASERIDWLHDRTGIGSVNARMAAAEEAGRRGRGWNGAGEPRTDPAP